MLSAFHPELDRGDVYLDRDESHHLVSVRRARVGDAVQVLDGRGRKGRGVVVAADPRRTLLRVSNVEVLARDTAPLWLAQAIPLGKTMDVIVQKCAELGVARIIPLLTRFSEVRLDGERAEKKAERWRMAAIEAVKQCGNPFIPDIDPPMPLDAMLAAGLPPLRLVCSLEAGALPLSHALRRGDAAGGVLLAIGPEGDFSGEEYARMRQADFIPVTLGPLVLRADTAAIAALAVAGELLRND